VLEGNKLSRKFVLINQAIIEMLRIGKKAVQEAQKRSLENGVPNVYSINGKLYYQLPDGTIKSETPKEYKE